MLFYMLVGHCGPKETTSIEQGAGQHIEMITVIGWYAGGMGGGVGELGMGNTEQHF